MSSGGAGHLPELSASCTFLPLMGSLSNVPSDPPDQDFHTSLPTIQPVSPNKGASTTHASTDAVPVSSLLPKGHPHAVAIASSGSSTAESISELTSSSSRDSLPTAQARGGVTTPQKSARSNRRNKPTNANARRSRAGSSDETGSDPKVSTAKTARNTQDTNQTPKSAFTQRKQASSNTNTSPTNQTRFMATTFGGPSGDSRRGVVSPRPKGRGMNVVYLCCH